VKHCDFLCCSQYCIFRQDPEIPDHPGFDANSGTSFEFSISRFALREWLGGGNIQPQRYFYQNLFDSRTISTKTKSLPATLVEYSIDHR
jgi:hypothetical protein